MSGRVRTSKLIYVLIRILQSAAETWDVDLRPPGSKLEVHVISVIHFSLIAPVVRPGFKERVDLFSSVFAEFEPTENCTMCDNGGGGSKRQEVKQLLKRLKKDNPDIEKSIFNSIHSVCLDTMPGWKTKGEEHSFLENYDKK